MRKVEQELSKVAQIPVGCQWQFKGTGISTLSELIESER